MGSLEGRTILLTRSEDSNAQLGARFEARGARVVSLPTIEFADPRSWDEADRAIRNLGEYDGFLFTSKTAVERFLRRADEVDNGSRKLLLSGKFYAIGERTEEALVREGFTDIVSPEISTAEGMAESLADEELSSKRFLFPKSEIARDVLPNSLRDRGAIVDEIVVYRNVPPLQSDLDRIRTELAGGTITVTAFFSPSAVRSFIQMLGIHALASTAVAVIGPTTAKTVEGFGGSVSILPERPTPESLLDSIEQYCHT